MTLTKRELTLLLLNKKNKKNSYTILRCPCYGVIIDLSTEEY